MGSACSCGKKAQVEEGAHEPVEGGEAPQPVRGLARSGSRKGSGQLVHIAGGTAPAQHPAVQASKKVEGEGEEEELIGGVDAGGTNKS
mmetsp:Transcript_9304/g.14875  ORF Transcript_9304/g.14875 Transcript_9304/m.14875 type:complete len:88 (+) Transcript_9304:189-452(+)|eukprot:1420618-Rhodomonas_salina.3